MMINNLTDSVRVLIVDDHKIIIDGIKSLLATEDKIKVSGEILDGSEVMSFLEKHSVDVILMDVTMPVMSGISITKEVHKKYPEVKVLALTMHEDMHYFKRIIEAGASGYILKNAGKQDLIQAIYDVAAGKSYFSERMYRDFILGNIKNDKKPKEELYLTKREIEVLRLIADEMKNHEIAEKLFISNRTVDTHRRNLLQKLNVKNTAGLVKYAVKSGLVE